MLLLSKELATRSTCALTVATDRVNFGTLLQVPSKSPTNLKVTGSFVDHLP
jgi:hypothetical protein